MSKNRIVLDGTPGESLTWLISLGDAVEHIRSLFVCFSKEFVDSWISGNPAAQEWKDLASFIASNLEIGELELALDAGIAFETYQEQRYTEEFLGDVKRAYDGIVDVLVTALEGKKPKSFFVFWAAFHGDEEVAEGKVMGDEYDSAELGKMPSTRRNPYFPYGVPGQKMEWEGGMSL